MKSIKIYVCGLMGLLVAVLISSCEKTFDEKTVQQKDFNNSTITQVYVATLNASRNYIYVDGAPVTGALLTSGSVFPATGFGFKVNPGLRAFEVKDTLQTSTQVPLKFSSNMQVGTHQTIFLYDTITSPKQKTVIDKIVVPTDTTSRLRFANFTYSPVAIPAVDIYSARRAVNIFTNVQVTDVTEYISIPSGFTDTFYIRPTGTTTNLQNFTPTPAPGVFTDIRLIFTPTITRNYTLVFRGGYRTTTTTLGTVRTLSLFVNY